MTGPVFRGRMVFVGVHRVLHAVLMCRIVVAECGAAATGATLWVYIIKSPMFSSGRPAALGAGMQPFSITAMLYI